MIKKNILSKLNRRTFLKAGATATAMPALSNLPFDLPTAKADLQQTNPKFRTQLCDLLKVEYPILQAGMSGVAGPELVAEVSKAGGLGILTGTLLPPDELRNRIRKVRELTDRPFGLNFLLHSDIRPPKNTASISEKMLNGVHGLLNTFRQRLGIPESFVRPPVVPDLLDTAFEILIEERVPIWSIGLGVPTPEMVERCHAHDIKVIAMVATVEDALEVAAVGVDAIVAQGSEAGGHRSTGVKGASGEQASIGTMALIPQVVEKVNLPVIAAGGISNGKGLVASIALGAQGIMMGTRFIATRESVAPDMHKKAVLEGSSNATTVTDVFTGMYARTLRNTFTEEYNASDTPVLPPFSQYLAARDIFEAAATQNHQEYFTLYCGQGIGTFHDMPSAGEVVHQVIREAHMVMTAWPQRIQLM